MPREVVHGAGKHSWDVDITTLPRFEKVGYCTTPQFDEALADTSIGSVVRHPVLQPQPCFYENLDTFTLQAHLHIQLG